MSENPPIPPVADERTPSRCLICFLSLLVAAVAVAAVVYMWRDQEGVHQRLQREWAEELAKMRSSTEQGGATAKEALQTAEEIVSRTEALETQMAKSQSQQIALEALYQELSSSRDEWILSEIEQILLIANEQLQLGGDVKSALVALQTADARLQRLEQPRLLVVRKQLTREIQALQALPPVDIVGIDLKLEHLAEEVDHLPLSHVSDGAVEEISPADTVPQPSVSWWRGLLREAWQDLRQLVRIRTVDEKALPLLTPRQEFLLRENLRLHLTLARMEALKRAEQPYRADLQAADKLIVRYFDEANPKVHQARKTIGELAASRLSIELPDISGSLAAIRKLSTAQERVAR